MCIVNEDLAVDDRDRTKRATLYPDGDIVRDGETTGGTGSLNNQIPVTLVAGAISGSHDFGYKQSDTASIGDTLYYDFDGDGVQDATETGIANVTVFLYQDVDRDGTIDAGVDELLYTTSTNASGQYLFSALPAGSYVVVVDTTDPDFPTNVTATGDPDLTAASIGDLDAHPVAIGA